MSRSLADRSYYATLGIRLRADICEETNGGNRH